MASAYFERALFVVGEQDSGKSTQLRSMFRDVRLATEGKVPAARNLREMYQLSNERSLYLRLTSPHEVGEWIEIPPGEEEEAENFLDKTNDKIQANTPHMGKRWNFACPLQPQAANHMPNVVDTVAAFVRRFNPERTRILFLSPDRHGALLQQSHLSLVVGLRAIPSIEVAWIDARERTPNGLLIADFFDFT